MSTIRGIRWFILFFFLPFGTAYSQTNDFEIWSSVQFRKDIGTKITLLLQEEFRFNENAARIDEYFTELGIGYSLNKYVEVTAYYRFIREQQPVSEYSNCHRFYGDVKIEYEIKHFVLSYRFRIQSKYTDIFSDENGLVPTNYQRNKIQLEYDIRRSRLFPYVSGEIFYNMDVERNDFIKARYTLGVEYFTRRKNKIETFYRIQDRFNRTDPVTSYILGISYSYRF